MQLIKHLSGTAITGKKQPKLFWKHIIGGNVIQNLITLAIRLKTYNVSLLVTKQGSCILSLWD